MMQEFRQRLHELLRQMARAQQLDFTARWVNSTGDRTEEVSFFNGTERADNTGQTVGPFLIHYTGEGVEVEGAAPHFQPGADYQRKRERLLPPGVSFDTPDKAAAAISGFLNAHHRRTEHLHRVVFGPRRLQTPESHDPYVTRDAALRTHLALGTLGRVAYVLREVEPGRRVLVIAKSYPGTDPLDGEWGHLDLGNAGGDRLWHFTVTVQGKSGHYHWMDQTRCLHWIPENSRNGVGVKLLGYPVSLAKAKLQAHAHFLGEQDGVSPSALHLPRVASGRATPQQVANMRLLTAGKQLSSMIVVATASPKYRAAYRTAQKQAKAALPGLRLNREQHCHITVVYVGDTDEGNIPEMKKVIAKVLKSAKPIEVSAERVGFFNHGKYGTPVVIHLAATPAIVRIQAKLEKALRKFRGPGAETYPHYNPHTTLGYSAKIVSEPERQAVVEAVDLSSFPTFKITEVLFSHSDDYQEIARFPLGDSVKQTTPVTRNAMLHRSPLIGNILLVAAAGGMHPRMEHSFNSWADGKKFKSEKTGRQVKFYSLPEKQQSGIRRTWKSKQSPDAHMSSGGFDMKHHLNEFKQLAKDHGGRKFRDTEHEVDDDGDEYHSFDFTDKNGGDHSMFVYDLGKGKYEVHNQGEDAKKGVVKVNGKGKSPDEIKSMLTDAFHKTTGIKPQASAVEKLSDHIAPPPKSKPAPGPRDTRGGVAHPQMWAGAKLPESQWGDPEEPEYSDETFEHTDAHGGHHVHDTQAGKYHYHPPGGGKGSTHDTDGLNDRQLHDLAIQNANKPAQGLSGAQSEYEAGPVGKKQKQNRQVGPPASKPAEKKPAAPEKKESGWKVHPDDVTKHVLDVVKKGAGKKLKEEHGSLTAKGAHGENIGNALSHAGWTPDKRAYHENGFTQSFTNPDGHRATVSEQHGSFSNNTAVYLNPARKPGGDTPVKPTAPAAPKPPAADHTGDPGKESDWKTNFPPLGGVTKSVDTPHGTYIHDIHGKSMSFHPHDGSNAKPQSWEVPGSNAATQQAIDHHKKMAGGKPGTQTMETGVGAEGETAEDIAHTRMFRRQRRQRMKRSGKA